MFRRDNGQLGFDDDAGAEVLARLLNGAVLIERAVAPHWTFVSSNASDCQRFVRRHAGRGVFGLVAPTATLLAELNELERREKQRKANDLRARFNREQLPVPQSRLADLVDREGEVNGCALGFLLDNAKIVSVWKHSDWGIHCVAYSRLREEIFAWAARSASGAIVELKVAKTYSDLPAW